MTKNEILMLTAFILYFVAVLGVGLWFFLRDKSKGEKDYFLGGRSMGPFVTAMSAQICPDGSLWDSPEVFLRLVWVRLGSV